MAKIVIQKKIKAFDKVINVDGDKSLSIRSLLIGSQSYGICKIRNLPKSEDILSTIEGLKKLGIKMIFKNKICLLYGNGLNGFNYKKKIIINAGNSGTFSRLLFGLLVKSPYYVKVVGDKSLSRRDFKRIMEPLNQFGAKFKSTNKNNLPIKILGTKYLKPISYFEKKGSAQIKSSIILAALNSPGKTIIKASKSRNHTELFLKFLKLPIRIKNNKKYDVIEISGENQFKSFNYIIPGDISSSAFFIVLTLLSENSKLKIKNVNVNPTRIGFIKIINKMGAKVKFINQRSVCGEQVADICVSSQKKFVSINCPVELNSNAIDEFLIIFLLASKAKGTSTFKNLGELNKKESPRLKIGSKILNKMSIKTETTNSSIKIHGNPNLKINKKIFINNYYKDHRIFMMAVIASLVFGGRWTIGDANCYKSSFPSFLKLIKKIGCNYKYSK